MFSESDSIDFINLEVAPHKEDVVADVQQHVDEIKKDCKAQYSMLLCMAGVIVHQLEDI